MIGKTLSFEDDAEDQQGPVMTLKDEDIRFLKTTDYLLDIKLTFEF